MMLRRDPDGKSMCAVRSARNFVNQFWVDCYGAFRGSCWTQRRTDAVRHAQDAHGGVGAVPASGRLAPYESPDDCRVKFRPVGAP